MEQIENEVAKGKHRLGLRPRGVPKGNPYAREELPHAERLRDVIVRPGVQCLDLVLFVFPDGQDDDGDRGPFPEAPDDLRAVEIGKAEIEHDQVRTEYRRPV